MWDGRPPQPFKISIAQSALDDLQARLERVRWPDQVPDSHWEYGTEVAYMRDLVAYWLGQYDWRAQERQLNEFPQFTANIDGIDVHFVHQAGEGASPLPLLLTHGWPGSFYEYCKLIPLLTRPSQFGGNSADAFSVVAPSMPGYQFSFRPGQKRFDLQRIAEVLACLMTEVLGYRPFGAHGHDWGAFIATRLGHAHAEQLIGLHIALLALPRESLPEGSRTEEEAAYERQLKHWLREETGYSAIMGTRPQTLSFSLTDSPVGIAAWIIEKFRRWSDCDGDVDRVFGRDMLLTNIMLYWLTGCINASFWPYYARAHGPFIVPGGGKVTAPMGYAEHPKEIITPPRSVAERVYTDIRRWTRMPRGGHFPALETPEALADEIRAFFRPLRRADRQMSPPRDS
jgi:microsomal epoxide hydrolase